MEQAMGQAMGQTPWFLQLDMECGDQQLQLDGQAYQAVYWEQFLAREPKLTDASDNNHFTCYANTREKLLHVRSPWLTTQHCRDVLDHPHLANLLQDQPVQSKTGRVFYVVFYNRTFSFDQHKQVLEQWVMHQNVYQNKGFRWTALAQPVMWKHAETYDELISAMTKRPRQSGETLADHFAKMRFARARFYQDNQGGISLVFRLPQPENLTDPEFRQRFDQFLATTAPLFDAQQTEYNLVTEKRQRNRNPEKQVLFKDIPAAVNIEITENSSDVSAATSSSPGSSLYDAGFNRFFGHGNGRGRYIDMTLSHLREAAQILHNKVTENGVHVTAETADTDPILATDLLAKLKGLTHG